MSRARLRQVGRRRGVLAAASAWLRIAFPVRECELRAGYSVALGKVHGTVPQRAAVLDRLRRAKGVKCAGVDAMVDAGAAPAETTVITPSDFGADLGGQGHTFMLIPHFTVAI